MSADDTRRDEAFLRLDEVESRSVRRDGGDDAPITQMGYSPGSQQARAIPGDAKFPFFKDPPDVSGPFEYRTSDVIPPAKTLTNPLPFVGGFGFGSPLDIYQNGPAIDVRGISQLAAVLTYLPGTITMQEVTTGVGILSIIAEHALQPFEASSVDEPYWVPIGVVNPILHTPAVVPGYAYRDIFSSEFRWQPFAGLVNPLPINTPLRQTLVFDVSSYQQFRFRFADLAAGGGELQNNTPAYLWASYYLMR